MKNIFIITLGCIFYCFKCQSQVASNKEQLSFLNDMNIQNDDFRIYMNQFQKTVYPLVIFSEIKPKKNSITAQQRSLFICKDSLCIKDLNNNLLEFKTFLQLPSFKTFSILLHLEYNYGGGEVYLTTYNLQGKVISKILFSEDRTDFSESNKDKICEYNIQGRIDSTLKICIKHFYRFPEWKEEKMFYRFAIYKENIYQIQNNGLIKLLKEIKNEKHKYSGKAKEGDFPPYLRID